MRKAMISLLGIALGGALAMSACSTNAPSTPAPNGSASGDSTAFKIGFLLPHTTTPRYETKDKPYFTEALKNICPSCELLYANANGEAATQQEQAQSMLTQGVDVLVVDPFDGVAAAAIVNAAKLKNVPVVAYDRLIKSPDLTYVISNNYLKVGELQGQAIVDKLKADNVSPDKGGIIMINGATTDNNAGNIKKGALSVIEKSGYKVLSYTDTWDPAEAQVWVSGQLTRFGPDKILAVYSANDNNAGAAIAAFKAVGVNKMPPMSGLDASVQGLQQIVAGQQLMTTYNPFKREAKIAAEAAYALAQGKTPPSDTTVDGHPASLNDPVAVNVSNIMTTVIADDFWKVSEICTAQYADACVKAGIK
jgi:D-xylose transport system substrate-binding protein